MNSCELVRCEVENVPTRGDKIPATYFEISVPKAEHCEIIGLNFNGGCGLWSFGKK